MTDHYARLASAVERLTPQYVSLLQDLVRVSTTRGHERTAQARVERQMREIGLAVETFDVDASRLHDLPSFNRTAADYRDRPNVAGRRRGAGGGRSLVLNAHIDTVPVEAPEVWSRDPLGAEIVDGRLYGRGACDDKAGVVECLLVAHAIADAGLTLAGDLNVVSVIEDETSGNGTLATVDRGYTGEGVVIVDGTWPERFIVSHMGQVTFRVRIRGVAGHASSEGPNPVDLVGPVVIALRQMVAARNAACHTPWGELTAPFFINVGHITGGVFPGSVPAECVVEGQYGFAPPDTVEQAQRAIRDALSSHGDRVSVVFEGLSTEPYIGDPENGLVQLLRDTVSRRQGAAIRESIIRGHCDLRHYAEHGSIAGCLYGPGGGRNVHGADEYFQLAHLPLVATNLACVTVDWCGVA